MTTLNVNTIKPAGSTLNLGESGDSVVLADDVKVNLVKDVGANTLWSSNGSGVLSSVTAGLGGAMRLLATTTVSSAVANIDFTSGIDSTYNEYIFKFINLSPATNEASFEFQVNASGQTGFDETITSTYFNASHSWYEDVVFFQYNTGNDQAQGTTYQDLWKQANLNQGVKYSGIGELHLFAPSSTTYVKQFYATTQLPEFSNPQPYSSNSYVAGYINTTAAIDEISFKFSSGNIAAGIIKMYGIVS